MDSTRRRVEVMRNHVLPDGNPSGGVRAMPCALGDSSSYERTTQMMDDVVVVSALRTPLTRAKRGGLKDTPAEDLLAAVLQATVARTGVPAKDVNDIVIGSVLAEGAQRANEVRMAAFLAGFPEEVPVRTVNRQCSSGLQAVADVACAIKAGMYDIGIAGGVETMSRNPMKWEGEMNPKLEQCPKAKSCLIPMGLTSENVAFKFGVDRSTQDAFAAESHRRAARARMLGKFTDEIVPVQTHVVDKEGTRKPITVSEDDGIRKGVSTETLSRLPPAFKKGGSTTAGNSSQVTDGASVVLLMKRSEAIKRRLPVLGVFRSFAVKGVDPSIMGIGPAVAIPAAVQKAGLCLDDIDLFELNEAFASQATFCINKLQIDPAKVNVNGGAIALGHPLGATGARCVATLLHEMKRKGKRARFGVVSMCIGSGMGAAAVFEAGDASDDAYMHTPVEQTYLSRDAIV